MKRSTTSTADQWSTELPPSRGDYRTIALLALELLAVDAPASRYDANLVITRLQMALTERTPREPLPEVEPF